MKGVSNYGKRQYIQALTDFNNVGRDANLDGEKHISIGSCYYMMGLVKEAKNEYGTALETNPRLAEAYYNLGVLNNNDGKTDMARKQFEYCLEADKKFTPARLALEKLDRPSSTSEWFKWWFSNGKGKKALGLGLILAIFALVIFFVAGSTFVFYINQGIASNTADQNIISQFIGFSQSILTAAITGVTIIIGLLIVILLLPSIRRFKLADIELEPIPIDTKMRQHMDAIISKVKIGTRSF